MTSRHFTILTLACLVMMNTASGAPIDFPKDEPVVTIDFPATWEIKHGDLNLKTGTADKTLGFSCGYVVTGTKATKAEISDTFGGVLGDHLSYICAFKLIGDPSPIEETAVNGAKAFKSTGKGTIENAESSATAYLLPINEDTSVTLAYWGSPEALKKHAPLITKIIGSIQRKAK